MMANFGDTRSSLMAALLKNKGGLTVDALGEAVNVTRTAVRQHLTTLERDGYVARSGTRSTGGRPQVLYVLTEAGQEQFARRYSWFADLLVGLLKEEMGKDALATKLHNVGAGVATALQQRSSPSGPLPERLGELSSAMSGLGYETESALQNRGKDLVAHNCIFHQLAAAHPEICAFDLGFMEKFANAKVEHVECMARGQHVCRFRFQSK